MDNAYRRTKVVFVLIGIIVNVAFWLIDAALGAATGMLLGYVSYSYFVADGKELNTYKRLSPLFALVFLSSLLFLFVCKTFPKLYFCEKDALLVGSVPIYSFFVFLIVKKIFRNKG